MTTKKKQTSTPYNSARPPVPVAWLTAPGAKAFRPERLFAAESWEYSLYAFEFRVLHT